jgi:hypothetical protein
MKEPSGKSKLALLLMGLCVWELMFGLGVLNKYELARGAPHDTEMRFYYVTDGWTVARPFIFALVFLLIFIEVISERRKILTGVSLLFGLSYYLFCLTWFDIKVLWENYQNPELDKPFLFTLHGWNEWDMLRGAILILLFSWWGYRNLWPKISSTN